MYGWIDDGWIWIKLALNVPHHVGSLGPILSPLSARTLGGMPPGPLVLVLVQ